MTTDEPQGPRSEAEGEPKTEAITVKVTASEKGSLTFVAAARAIAAPPTLLREMSLREVVEEAARLRARLAGVAA